MPLAASVIFLTRLSGLYSLRVVPDGMVQDVGRPSQPQDWLTVWPSYSVHDVNSPAVSQNCLALHFSSVSFTTCQAAVASTRWSAGKTLGQPCRMRRKLRTGSRSGILALR